MLRTKSLGEYKELSEASIILKDKLAVLNKLEYYSSWEVGKPHFIIAEFKFVSFKLNNDEISFASSSRKM